VRWADVCWASIIAVMAALSLGAGNGWGRVRKGQAIYVRRVRTKFCKQKFCNEPRRKWLDFYFDNTIIE